MTHRTIRLHSNKHGDSYARTRKRFKYQNPLEQGQAGRAKATAQVARNLGHPDHASTAQQIDQQLDKMVASQPNEAAREALRGQLTITAALSHVIPVGLAGLFCAIMVAALISTYDSFMHTWGAVFLQDVVMPFSKKRYGNNR